MVSVNIQNMKEIELHEYPQDELGRAFLTLDIECDGGGSAVIFINKPAEFELLKKAIEEAENSTIWED